MNGRSCMTNLLEFLEAETNDFDRGESFNVIYLNFAKASDLVPYQQLVKKVAAHGLTGELQRWVSSWLTKSVKLADQREAASIP
jgi:hypothetical protein